MKAKNQVIFWIVIITLLTVVFSTSLKSWVLAFYFVIFLFPVVLGTSIFFNNFLLPNYLLRNRRWKFGLYFGYMLIVSVYLELLVMILAFVILANYQIENLGKIASDIFSLTIILYLIVFVDGFIGVLRELKKRNSMIAQLEEGQQRNARTSIVIKVNRKNVPIDVSNITLVESLSDYVKVHTQDQQYVTKQKISMLESSLPEHFLRIHRSFLINRTFIEAFNREGVTVMNQTYPIGRTYKKECLRVLAEKDQ